MPQAISQRDIRGMTSRVGTPKVAVVATDGSGHSHSVKALAIVAGSGLGYLINPGVGKPQLSAERWFGICYV